MIEGKDVSGATPSLVGWRTLFESLHNAAGKRLLVVDTCHAKDAAGTFDARSLKKRSASSHFPLLLSSDSKELSQDYPKATARAVHLRGAVGVVRELARPGPAEACRRRERVPDLVIADYQLAEGETGVELIEAIRHEFNAQIPALLLTADTSQERAREAYAHQLPVMYKPVTPQRLRAMISELLDGGERAGIVEELHEDLTAPRE